jgi:phenol 2-monooxygenase
MLRSKDEPRRRAGPPRTPKEGIDVQFHLNGFRPGDPGVAPDLIPPAPDALPDVVDVLIVGCGPAGLVLAAQLAAFPDIDVRIVDRRSGPLEIGQADGIACRTLEMFQAFGLSDRLMAEGYWVNETTFWGPDEADRSRLVRTGRIQDVEDGLSEFPHLIVNQARIHQHLLEQMRRSARHLTPDYGYDFVDVQVDPEADAEHPALVTLEHTSADGTTELRRVRARYVVGCDGARSRVRASIGRELRGDSANQAWGVMDVLAVTDFPDIRFKGAIQSTNGNIVLIPREGGYLVRFYIELDELEPGQRVAASEMTVDTLIEATRRVLHPHTLDVREVAWWSVYEIGQRLTDSFHDVGDGPGEHPRVFIAGDACHTHSPKAGQGMNVSMQDAFNLGWKLAAVLRGRAGPELLATYSSERQAVAQELIEFDREWARMFSAPPKDPTRPDEAGSVSPEEFRLRFQQSGRFTAGVATRYRPSILTGDGAHQSIAGGFGLGERFHSAPVVRAADGKAMQLGHVHEADGRWRLYVFADDRPLDDPGSLAAPALELLGDPELSPTLRFTPPDADVDAVIDVRVVLPRSHREIDVTALPTIALPAKGALGLLDYEKTFAVDTDPRCDIYALRGIDRRTGCAVLVRPDQYVAQVLPLDEVDRLEDFLAQTLHPMRRPALTPRR